ncbi:MAG: hypothetical protein ACI4XR_01180 [Bacilli bacterium]
MKNEIGTDPTLVEVIETLDAPVPQQKVEDNNLKKENNDNKNSKNKESFIKKLLFVILIIALMGGVAYGVYYYLNMAKNKNQNNTTAAFTLNNITIKVGDSLPESMDDYGNFDNLDISKCSLNTKNVDTSKVGVYDYYVTCGNSKYSAKVVVKEKTDDDQVITEKVVLNLKNEFTYLVLGNSINVERLISSPNNYTFSFENKENALNSLTSVGFKNINIKAVDENNNDNTITSFVYVIENEPKMIFNCTSPDGSIIDKFVFDNNKNSMNVSVRIKVNTYDNDTEYDNIIKKINDGKITINGEEGYALIDKENKQISLLSFLTSDILDKEYNSSFPTNYNEISNYYRNILKYNCSF